MTFDLDMPDTAKPSEPVFEGQAGAAVAAPSKAGRPKGSQNKLNRDLVRLVQHKMGRHPLEEMVRLYQSDLEDIKEAFGCTSLKGAGEIKERLLHKLVDKTSPALAQVKFTDEKRLVVVMEGHDGSAEAAVDLLGFEFNDNNDLDGGKP